MDCIIGVDSIWNSFRHQSVSLYTVVESRRSACAYSARWLGDGVEIGKNEDWSGSWDFSHGKNQQRERESDSHTVP